MRSFLLQITHSFILVSLRVSSGYFKSILQCFMKPFKSMDQLVQKELKSGHFPVRKEKENGQVSEWELRWNGLFF